MLDSLVFKNDMKNTFILTRSNGGVPTWTKSECFIDLMSFS